VCASLFVLCASPLPLEEVVSRLQQNYDKINTYRAQFTQEVSSTSFDRTISQGKGEVIYQKPGKMYWHYGEPEEHFYITDGKTFWDYLPGEKQVVVMEISEALRQSLPRAFLFGMGKLKDQFEVSFHSGRITDAEGNYWLDLVPKEDAERQTLGTIQFRVDSKEFLVRQAELLDALGNKNHLVFKGIQVNHKVDEKIFSFQVPQGVELIQMTPMEPAPAPDTSDKP
jgi:outer membrane lipoprotein carrier protein